MARRIHPYTCLVYKLVSLQPEVDLFINTTLSIDKALTFDFKHTHTHIHKIARESYIANSVNTKVKNEAYNPSKFQICILSQSTNSRTFSAYQRGILIKCSVPNRPETLKSKKILQQKKEKIVLKCTTNANQCV